MNKGLKAFNRIWNQFTFKSNNLNQYLRRIVIQELKRNKPLKPIDSCCQTCELEVFRTDKFCSECGQKIDWESE